MHKKSIGDLAIFGGAPSTDMPLHSCRPYNSNKEDFLALLDKAFDDKVFTNNGP